MCRLLLALVLIGCARHPVEIEKPTTGRALGAAESAALQDVADKAFRDVHLPGLPPRITLIVKWGKDVTPETGETGAAGYPGNVGLTLDPDRDVLATIRTWVRPCLVHELHHLARQSQVKPRSLRDRLVSEGLATAFERDVAHIAPPWGEPPPEAWVAEVLALPLDADQDIWFSSHPDGRRNIGIRVGTLLVDRATRASGRSPADLTLVPSAEVLGLASSTR